MNEPLFFFINNIRSPFLDTIMHIVTSLGDHRHVLWLFPILIGVQWAARGRESLLGDLSFHRLLLSFVIGYVITALIVAGLKYGLRLPRPSAVYGLQVLHARELPDSPYTFPSGHSAFAALVAACLWQRVKTPLKVLLAVYVVWVGLSRINLGMHFPVDVVVGFVVGGGCGWLATQVAPWALVQLRGLVRR